MISDSNRCEACRTNCRCVWKIEKKMPDCPVHGGTILPNTISTPDQQQNEHMNNASVELANNLSTHVALSQNAPVATLARDFQKVTLRIDHPKMSNDNFPNELPSCM